MAKVSAYASADVFYGVLVANFVDMIDHVGSLVNSVLTLLDEVAKEQTTEFSLDVPLDGIEESVVRQQVSKAIQSRSLLGEHLKASNLIVSSTKTVPCGDGRRYEYWNLSYERTGYYGEPLLKCQVPLNRLSLQLSATSIRKIGVASYCKLVSRIFEVCSSETTECASGFVDIVSSAESSGGRCYSTAAAGGDWCGWHRLVENYEWGVDEGHRYQRLQGVFWANYLGPTLTKRLGSVDDVAQQFEAFDANYYKHLSHSAKACGSGRLFMTSDQPLNLAEPHFAGADYEARMAVWLRRRFRQCGIL